MLAGARQQVQQFPAEEFILAGEVGDHPHHGHGHIRRPSLAIGKETGGRGQSARLWSRGRCARAPGRCRAAPPEVSAARDAV